MEKMEIVLGPPGTGKTTTLLDMVDSELERGVPAEQIGYVSFTKRAAREAIERACEKFDLKETDLRYFRTLHSMCFQSLGLSNSDVFEGRKLEEFGDWIGVEVSRFYSMEEGSSFGFKPGDRALFMENLARVRKVPLRQAYDQECDDLDWRLVDRVSRGLAQYKQDTGLVDYTDMLTMFAESEWAPPLEVLFVDEAQDLSKLQWAVVHKLALNCRRVVIAGDDDQAIYKWAGADVEYFIDVPGEVTVLNKSWRVPRAVQILSQEIIGRVQYRRPKEWAARDEEGELVRAQEIEEVDFWGEDVLVLARNNFVLRNVVEPLLRSEGVIFEHRAGSSVKRSTLEAIVNWERLRRGEAVTGEEARKVYAMMASGSGVRRGFKTLPGVSDDDHVSLPALREDGGLEREDIWHEALERIALEERTYLLRALQKGESLRKKPRVRLSTIHSAKGGEADQVVLLRDMAYRTWREMEDDPEDEARVWYVAATRARRQLTVVAPRERTSYDI